MDEKPFFVFNITDIKDNQIEELKKFHKAYYEPLAVGIVIVGINK